MEKRQTFKDYGATRGIDNPGYMSSPPSTQAPATPSAPPTGNYHTVPGYEGMLPDGRGIVIPPPKVSAPLPASKNLPAETNWNVTSITEEDAREVFINYASSKCCYSSAPARDGVITSLEPFNAYKYRLETFAETRVTQWTQVPYTGQTVDALIQPAPAPWAIEAKAPAFFQDRMQGIRVPFTSSVKSCDVCMETGIIQCTRCSGSGNKSCLRCAGTGSCQAFRSCGMCGSTGRQHFQTVCYSCGGTGSRYANGRCVSCYGSGRKICDWCYGQGVRECEKCRGNKKLLVFINLKVYWVTYKDEYMAEQASGLNSENLSKVSGKAIFTDSQSELHPLVGVPDPTISRASERLIREHQAKYFQTSHILQQRHTIELIPVTKVTYTWKEKSYSYIVFGNENCVYTDNYPATCCCSVM